MTWRAVSCAVVLCFVVSCCAVWCCVVSCRVDRSVRPPSRYVVLCCVTWRVVSCDVSCCVVSCRADRSVSVLRQTLKQNTEAEDEDGRARRGDGPQSARNSSVRGERTRAAAGLRGGAGLCLTERFAASPLCLCHPTLLSDG